MTNPTGIDNLVGNRPPAISLARIDEAPRAAHTAGQQRKDVREGNGVAAVERAALREWQQGWTLVLAALAGASLPALTMYTHGLFMQPLQAEFGWSRSQISSVLTLNAVFGVILTPPAGLLVDRIGARAIAIPGVVLYCAMFAALSQFDGSYPLYLAIWAAIALGAILVQPAMWAKVVASRFDHSRGFALGVMLVGPGLTGILVPLVGNWLLLRHGWRTAYIGIAAIWGSITLPLVVAFLKDPPKVVRRADAVGVPGLSLRAGLRSAAFYKLTLATLLIAFVQSGTMANYIPFLRSAGMSPSDAALAASAAGLATMPGRLCTGFLVDRFDAARVGTAMFLIPSVSAVGLLWFDGSLAHAVAIAIFVGLITGAEMDLISYLMSRHMGLRHFGFYASVIAAMMSAGLGFGAFAASRSFDVFRSYDLAIMASIPISLVAAALLLSLRAPPEEFRPRQVRAPAPGRDEAMGAG